MNAEQTGMLLTVAGWTSLVMSALSFGVFVVLAIRRGHPPAKPLGGAGDVELHSGLTDIAKLAEALGKLAEGLAKWTEALAKAGPAISALVASIVFLGLAVVCAAVGR